MVAPRTAAAVSPGQRRTLEPGPLWRRLTLLFVVGGLVVLVAFGVWSWFEAYSRVDSELSVEVAMAANGVQAMLAGLGNDLPYLGGQLPPRDRPQFRRRAYALLRSYQEHHPSVASMVLFAPDGRMLVNSARPFDAPLPDPRRHPRILASIRAALGTRGLWVGRTQRGLVLGDWRIPVRYAVRTPAGTPRFILQASILLKTLTDRWRFERMSASMAVGLITLNGMHVARLPGPNPARLYSTRMAGPLMQALERHPQRLTGAYRGRVQSDWSRRIGRYARVPGFPMVLYISVPESEVWALWWRGSVPFLVLGLLGLGGYVGLSRVLLRRERAHLHALAAGERHDPLTGLPNLLAAREWLERRLGEGARTLGLLQVHLDDFADVHDALGADGAQQVLQEAARRLFEQVRNPQALVAHLGVEQYLVGVPGADLLRIHRLARRLQETLNEPLFAGGQTLRLHATIGVSCFPDDADNADELLRAVASAVHAAQQGGRGQIALYDPDSSRRSVARVGFQQAVERALAGDEFALHYQPIIDLEERRLVGAEALIRWDDPQRGLLPPGEFIPLAEATGWISALGDWVVRRACRDLKEWEARGLHVRLSLNLSAEELRNPDYPLKLRRTLAVSHVEPGAIELEVTETAVMQDVQRSAAALRSLADIGVRFAIDDFGTGHASLAYLRRLPVQVIKIDRSFVAEVTSSPADRAIVEAVAALARGLGCVTVAEGIETESQYRVLRELGVDRGQGYWIARPQPRTEFEALIREHLRLPAGFEPDVADRSQRRT